MLAVQKNVYSVDAAEILMRYWWTAAAIFSAAFLRTLQHMLLGLCCIWRMMSKRLLRLVVVGLIIHYPFQSVIHRDWIRTWASGWLAWDYCTPHWWGDRLALKDGDGRELTYAQMRQCINAIASELRNNGIRAGARVWFSWPQAWTGLLPCWLCCVSEQHISPLTCK